MKFTDRAVQALRRKTTRYEVFEDGHPGFGVRVGPRGRKAWVWLYRYQGKARRLTLGTYPETSLADAHEKQAQAEKKLEAGSTQARNSYRYRKQNDWRLPSPLSHTNT